jgi:DNA-directed RNA polymerase subunit RPC12/RpoP
VYGSDFDGREKDGMDCVLATADLKKAFNTTNRSTVVREAQRIAGAGRIMMTRWQDRTYTFEGEVRGLGYNRGTDAGAMLSVWGFDRWISTDTSTQMRSYRDGKQVVTIAPCNYSDDRNPNSRGSDVENGRFQTEVLNEMVLWGSKEGATFHTEGPKAPCLLIFSQIINGERTKNPEGVDSLELCGTHIARSDRQRILGIIVSTKPSLFSEGDKSCLFKTSTRETTYKIQAQKIINNYGYFLEPNLQYLVGTAYRLQSLREEQTPERLRTVCMAYIVGKLQFGLALYYVRSTICQLNIMRFYYGMAVSAVANLSAYETLGASCCASQSVNENNASFILLLRITGFLTLRQLAIKQARSIVSQLLNVRPEWFSNPNTRLQVIEEKKQKQASESGLPYIPSYCEKAKVGTLVYDLWELCKSSLGEDVGTISLRDDGSGINRYKRSWLLAAEACTEDNTKSGLSARIRETYAIKMKFELRVLEINDRKLKRRTPSNPLQLSKTCKIYPPDFSEISSNLSRISFDCGMRIPGIRLNSEYIGLQCVACGDKYTLSKNKSDIRCAECKRYIHKACCRKLKLISGYFACEQICYNILPNSLASRKLRYGDSIGCTKSPARTKCVICGLSIAEWINTKDDNRTVYNDRVSLCSERCGFGMHQDCRNALERIQKAENAPSVPIATCSDITYWIQPNVISSTNFETLSGPAHLEYLIDCGDIIRVRRLSDKRKIRYDNPISDFTCEFCQLEIPIEQEDHLWSHCMGLRGTPPSRDPLEAVYRVKRRCLELAIATPDSILAADNLTRDPVTPSNDASLDGHALTGYTRTIPSVAPRIQNPETLRVREQALFSTVLKTPAKKKPKLKSESKARLTSKNTRYNLRSSAIPKPTISKRNYSTVTPPRSGRTDRLSEAWTPSKSPRPKRYNCTDPNDLSPATSQNRYSVLVVESTEPDKNIEEIQSLHVLRCDLGTKQSRCINKNGKQRTTFRKTAPKKAKKSSPSVTPTPLGAKAPNSSNLASSSQYPLRGIYVEKRGRSHRYNLRLRPSQTRSGDHFDSTLSNNTETLAKVRGCNFRLSSRSTGASSHSEPPAALGAPGLPATADLKFS